MDHTVLKTLILNSWVPDSREIDKVGEELVAIFWLYILEEAPCSIVKLIKLVFFMSAFQTSCHLQFIYQLLFVRMLFYFLPGPLQAD